MLNQKGQLPAFFLLLLAVVATVGISIAGTSLRQTEQKGELSDADRAFKAAEAGIEEALLQYSQNPAAITQCDNTNADPGDDCPYAYTEADSQVQKVTVEEPGVSGAYEVQGVEKDDVAQLDLRFSGGGSYSGGLTIEWHNPDNVTPPIQQSEQSALVFTEVYGSAPNYQIQKTAVDCYPSRSGASGFTPAAWTGSVCRYAYTVQANSQILRLRNINSATSTPGKVDITISRLSPPLPGQSSSLPAQEVVITAVGQAGTSESTEEVRIKKPALPAIFDFVLFAGSGSLTHE